MGKPWASNAHPSPLYSSSIIINGKHTYHCKITQARSPRCSVDPGMQIAVNLNLLTDVTLLTSFIKPNCPCLNTTSWNNQTSLVAKVTATLGANLRVCDGEWGLFFLSCVMYVMGLCTVACTVYRATTMRVDSVCLSCARCLAPISGAVLCNHSRVTTTSAMQKRQQKVHHCMCVTLYNITQQHHHKINHSGAWYSSQWRLRIAYTSAILGRLPGVSSMQRCASSTISLGHVSEGLCCEVMKKNDKGWWW